MLSRICFELAAGEPVLVAVEPDRGLPDALDQVEHIGALLVAHGVAEDAAEQADVVAQPDIGLQRLGVLGPVGRGSACRMAWSGGTWLATLQKLAWLPGQRVCNFFAAAQDEVGGGSCRPDGTKETWFFASRRRTPELYENIHPSR